MIIVTVEFKPPKPMTTEQAREAFLGSAPKYQGVPGLVRKYYFISPDGTKAGGVYLWASRKDAEQLFTEEWKNSIRSKYHAEPALTYLNCPVVVDNLTNKILKH